MSLLCPLPLLVQAARGAMLLCQGHPDAALRDLGQVLERYPLLRAWHAAIWLAVAALVAYEMGRGTGMSAPAAQPAEPMAVGTHPDA